SCRRPWAGRKAPYWQYRAGRQPALDSHSLGEPSLGPPLAAGAVVLEQAKNSLIKFQRATFEQDQSRVGSVKKYQPRIDFLGNRWVAADLLAGERGHACASRSSGDLGGETQRQHHERFLAVSFDD